MSRDDSLFGLSRFLHIQGMRACVSTSWFAKRREGGPLVVTGGRRGRFSCTHVSFENAFSA